MRRTLANYGGFQKDQRSLADVGDERCDLTVRTNIYPCFHFAKAGLEHMREGSAIINTGPTTGLDGSKTLLDYAATTGATHAFTKSLAQSLVERKIRVHCVAPGPIRSPLNPQRKPADQIAAFGGDTPMKRPGQPAAVAAAYVFFAFHADSSYIIGERTHPSRWPHHGGLGTVREGQTRPVRPGRVRRRGGFTQWLLGFRSRSLLWARPLRPRR